MDGARLSDQGWLERVRRGTYPPPPRSEAPFHRHRPEAPFHRHPTEQNVNATRNSESRRPEMPIDLAIMRAASWMATAIAGITSDGARAGVRKGRARTVQGSRSRHPPRRRDRTDGSERQRQDHVAALPWPDSPAISTVQVSHAAQFSYVGHRGGLNLQLTPLQNLRWSAAIEGIGCIERIELSSLLDGVGLAGYEFTPCQQLSAGQQRRAALARLGFGNAALWLLDEPLTALDDAGCALVRDLLARHRAAGGAALCATHQSLGLDGRAAMCSDVPRDACAIRARAVAGRAFTAQVQRDLTIAFRSRSELINPLMFYVMGISMFPLGVGPGRGSACRKSRRACCGCSRCCRRCCRSTRCSAATSTTARWSSWC